MFNKNSSCIYNFFLIVTCRLRRYSLPSLLAVSDDVFQRKFVNPGDDFDQYRTMWIAQNTGTNDASDPLGTAAESQAKHMHVSKESHNDQPSNNKSINNVKKEGKRTTKSPAPSMKESNRTGHVGRKQHDPPKKKFWKRLKRIDGNKPTSQ